MGTKRDVTGHGTKRATVPGLDNLLAVSHALEILAHGFCLLSLELNGYLITAAACAADVWWVAHQTPDWLTCCLE